MITYHGYDNPVYNAHKIWMHIIQGKIWVYFHAVLYILMTIFITVNLYFLISLSFQPSTPINKFSYRKNKLEEIYMVV